MSPDDHTDREPDYRMSLAAERTYLAYVRTGLALLAAGVAVAGALPDAGAEILRRVVGVILVVIGAFVLGLARYRWRAVDRAMRAGEPLPNPASTQWVSWALIAVAGAAVAIALLA